MKGEGRVVLQPRHMLFFLGNCSKQTIFQKWNSRLVYSLCLHGSPRHSVETLNGIGRNLVEDLKNKGGSPMWVLGD